MDFAPQYPANWRRFQTGDASIYSQVRHIEEHIPGRPWRIVDRALAVHGKEGRRVDEVHFLQRRANAQTRVAVVTNGVTDELARKTLHDVRPGIEKAEDD